MIAERTAMSKLVPFRWRQGCPGRQKAGACTSLSSDVRLCSPFVAASADGIPLPRLLPKSWVQVLLTNREQDEQSIHHGDRQKFLLHGEVLQVCPVERLKPAAG